MTTAKDNLIAGKPLIRLGNVSVPTLTLYKPRGKNTGAAVVVFPGGGYSILAIDLEGTEVCDWLNSAGVTCLLLKYRVPNTGPYPKSAAALQDAQRAMGLARQHATEWGIDPHRIGVLGFSAGGHLAAAISTHYDKRLYDPVDAADSLSCRPDFAVVIYPGYLALADKNFAANADINPRSTRRLHSLCRQRTIRCMWRTPLSTSSNSRTQRCRPSCMSMRRVVTATDCDAPRCP
jgi:acetyl esterase/lipase